MTRSYKVMLVAAEASGDALAASLAQVLRDRLGDQVSFIGIGGPKMAALGIESPFDIAELSILGWIDGLKAYGRVRQRVAETVEMATREKPDAVILVDSWGFTIRVAKAIRKVMPQIALIKYVAPQVWASRPRRAKVLADSVDYLLALYPMDAPYFDAEGLPTIVVGSAALHADMSSADGAAFRHVKNISREEPLLVVLPGSRPSEVERMMPVYEETIRRLKQTRPEVQIAVVAAGTVAHDVTGRVAAWPFRAQVVTEAEKYAAMKAADVALATSGTVSTEIAIAGTPMVIAYRIDNLSYGLMKNLVTAKYITMINIAADAEIAPEFIQHDATPDKLLAAVSRLLDDPSAARAQVAHQNKALELMGRGGPNPSHLAADAVVQILKDR